MRSLWACLSSLACCVLPCAAGGSGFNVVLITVDTLRPDHVGAYGYARRTTPVLDGLAGEGVLFENAYAQAPWTLPSLASLLSSRYPEFHGVRHGRLEFDGRIPTFVDVLNQGGYRTAVFSSGISANPRFGLRTRFATSYGADRARVQDLVSEAIHWVEHGGTNPFFLWLHPMEAHLPHACPQSHRDQFDPDYQGEVHRLERAYPIDVSYGWLNQFMQYYNGAPHADRPVYQQDPELLASVKRIRADPKDVAHVAAHYDGCVNFIDHHIGRLAQSVRRLGHWDETVWIVSADHGERLGGGIGIHPSKIGHFSGDMSEELLRVPLIIRRPGRRGGIRVSEPVMLIDIAPTVLSMAGLKTPSGMQGSDLASLLEGGARHDKRMPAHAAEYCLDGHYCSWPASDSEPGTRGGWVWMLRRGAWKLIRHDRGWSLFDLAVDPTEQRDLAASEPLRFLEAGSSYLDLMTDAQLGTGSLY